MRLSVQAFLATFSVITARVACVEASIVPSFFSGASRWPLTTRNADAFGLAKSIATLTRGGSEAVTEEPEMATTTAAADDDDDDDEVLYLPGLLDVSVVKTSKVGTWFVIDIFILCSHSLSLTEFPQNICKYK